MNARTNAQEWSRVWSHIVTEWPRLRRFSDQGGWYDDVKHHDIADLTAGFHNLRRKWTQTSEPRIAHYLTEVDVVASTRKHQTGTRERGTCGSCEHGWIYDDHSGRTTVRPCPNHCPMGART